MAINLELYNFFCSIAEFNSFSEASKRLYISQPAITQKINDLEQELGQKLFIRTAKGIELTDEGKKLFEELKEPIKVLRNIKNIKLNQTKKELLSIGIDNKIFDIGFLYKMVINFYKMYPQKIVEVRRIEPDKGLDYIRNEYLNLYMTNNIRKIRRKNLEVKNQIILHPCFYTSTEFYNLNIKEINFFLQSKFTYIVSKEDTIEKEILNKLVKKYKICIQKKYEVENAEIQHILVNNNMGICFGFKENIIDEIQKGLIKEIKIGKQIEEYILDIVVKEKCQNDLNLEKVL